MSDVNNPAQEAKEDSTQMVDTSAAQKTAEPKDGYFDAEYVQALRAEAAGYRKRLRALEEKQQKDEEAKLSESEKLQKRLSELEKERDAWVSERQERQLRHEVELNATKLGIVDLEAALKLLDTSDVQFDENGRPLGIPAKLKELVQKRPYLLAKPPARESGGGNGNSQSLPEQGMNDWIRKRIN